jgi:hypothetical protein
MPRPPAAARQIRLLYDGALAGSKASGSCEPIRLGGQMAQELIARTVPGSSPLTVMAPQQGDVRRLDGHDAEDRRRVRNVARLQTARP